MTCSTMVDVSVDNKTYKDYSVAINKSLTLVFRSVIFNQAAAS
jgi:hypothetical protein